jgi:CBS domain containing-hemolysin-like protein
MEWAALGLAVVLVIFNAFFVAAEYALVKVRPTSLQSLADQSTPGAARAAKMRLQIESWLSATQIGITLASLGLGWVGEPAFAKLLMPLFARIAPESAEQITHTVALVLAFATITFLHIVFGEQVPKMMAIRNPEKAVIALALPLKMFRLLLYPVIAVLNSGTRAALRLFGLEQPKEGSGQAEVLDADELKLVFANSARAGTLQGDRADLLNRALSMMEKTARQVLVPRTMMKYLDLDATLEDNLLEARNAGHTWLPVVRGSLDQVEGLVNVKDLLFLLSRGELKSIAQVQRPVLFVPENVTLEQLLAEFKRRGKQTAVVVDEHGGTSGIVTLADVVAELVGSVAEVGRKVEPVKSLPGGRLELPGTAQLDDLEHTLEVKFDVDRTEIGTIAGYLMAKLGRVPVAGDVWVLDDYRINVVRTEGPRVQTVRIEPKNAPGPSPSPPMKSGVSSSKPELPPVRS